MRMSKDLKASLVTHLATGLGQLGRGRPAGTVDGMSACGLRARLELPDSMAASGRLDFVHGRQGSKSKCFHKQGEGCTAFVGPALGDTEHHFHCILLLSHQPTQVQGEGHGSTSPRCGVCSCVCNCHTGTFCKAQWPPSHSEGNQSPYQDHLVCPARPCHLGLSLTTLPRPPPLRPC